MPAFPRRIDRIRTPIGNEIHAETPEEIAVSILSEVLDTLEGLSGAADPSELVVVRGAGHRHRDRLAFDQGRMAVVVTELARP